MGPNGNGFPNNLRDLSAKTAYALSFLGMPLPISNPLGTLFYAGKIGGKRVLSCQKANIHAKNREGREGDRREGFTEARSLKRLRLVDVPLCGPQVVMARGSLDLERLVAPLCAPRDARVAQIMKIDRAPRLVVSEELRARDPRPRQVLAQALCQRLPRG